MKIIRANFSVAYNVVNTSNSSNLLVYVYSFTIQLLSIDYCKWDRAELLDDGSRDWKQFVMIITAVNIEYSHTFMGK